MCKLNGKDKEEKVVEAKKREMPTGGKGGRKVVLVGWDGADWKVIHPMLDKGMLPNLERIVNEGVIGNLATLYPELSPMLWTSISTGKRPFKHGIYGFTEPDPHSGGVRPITIVSRRTKAIWNILSQAGKKNIVVGWWPSHPAEPINGVMVSNHYHRAVADKDKPWPVQPGTVHPRRLIRNLAELRYHPQQLDAGHIMPFVPKAADVDQDKDKRLSTLGKIIGETLSIRNASLAIMHHEPWDFAAIYFDAIDHFSHAFMRYHPPREEWVQEKDFELYNEVVTGGYKLHDIILGRILEEAGEDATVILVSDHGFHSDHLRPRSIPMEPAGPAAQHRHYGIFAIKGPGIKKDERIYGASLLDVCPTLLTLFGLPVGEDMDGKVLLNAFEQAPAVTSIPTWDAVEGPAGTHPPDMQMDPVEAQEAVNQLVALGYIDKPDENREKAVSQTVRELDYNLARAYMDAGRHADAIELLEGLTDKWPEEHRFGVQLVSCFQAVDRTKEARTLLEAVIRRKQEDIPKAREEMRKWREERKDKKPEDFDEKEQRELRQLRARASFNPYAMDYLMGSLLLAEGDKLTALERLRHAEKADARQPGLHLKIGQVYNEMRRWRDAQASYAQALELDPDSAEGYRGLAQALLGLKKSEDAAEAALESVGLLFHNPRAHYLLGVALHRLDEITKAIQALEVAISQNPNFPEAHRRLAYIYKWRRSDDEKAAEHRKFAREAVKRLRDIKAGKLWPTKAAVEDALAPPDADEAAEAADARPKAPGPPPIDIGPVDLPETVTVVSGLPRSGTSLMMQMLDAGGLRPLTDGKRKADEDNTRGYYELERATRLRQDAGWLPEAKGNAVKLVAQLLPFLRQGFNYRVVFMERDMTEILASQRVMLERQGKKGADLTEEKLARIFEQNVGRTKRLLAGRGIPALYVGFGECIKRPAETAARVNAFLGGTLDEAAMAAAIAPEMQRQRAGAKPSE